MAHDDSEELLSAGEYKDAEMVIQVAKDLVEANLDENVELYKEKQTKILVIHSRLDIRHGFSGLVRGTPT
jgi:hypothetical protein